jgi:aspartate aminotransferase
MSRHVSRQHERLLAAMEPFVRFFTDGAWSHRTRPGCDFVAGNPQEMPLPGLVDAIRRHAEPKDKDWFAYKETQPFAQEAAARGARRTTGIPIEPEDVAMTTGAFAGLAVALRTVLDPGDEVIFCSPPWFFYEAMILSAGGTPVRTRIEPPAFDLPLDGIEAAITPKTRAVIVNTPHNPTGRMYPAADLERLGGILTDASERHGRPVYLLSDEAYNRIVYAPNTHTSPAAFYPHSFLIYTYGKQLLAPGERVGYLALVPDMPAREDIRTAVFVQQLVIGWAFPNAIQQYALEELEEMSIDLEHLQRKRDRMVAGLRDAGYDLHVPEGTFYLLPASPNPDDWAFTERLAREEVYVLPGSVVELPGFFRISVTASDDMIEQALPIFERARKDASG